MESSDLAIFLCEDQFKQDQHIMFARLVAIGLLLTFCMSVTYGQGDDFRERRRDRDYSIDRGFRGELSEGTPGGESDSRSRSGRRRGFDPISRLDANQNGVVDQSEIDGIPERFRRMMDARGFKLESGESVDTVRNRVRQRFENERRERERRTDDSSDNDRANRSTPPPAFKPRDRERITVDLPESYAEVDSDLDGQIGLYEWIVARRNDLELFDEIDRNTDGLLTPRELSAWDKLKNDTGKTSLTVTKRERLLIVAGTAKPETAKPADRRDRRRSVSDDDRNRGRSRADRSSGRRDRGRD